MRAKARGAPRNASLANQADVVINAVDSLHIRLALTGTPYDKYPGKPRYHPSCRRRKPRKVDEIDPSSLSRPLIDFAPLGSLLPDR